MKIRKKGFFPSVLKSVGKGILKATVPVAGSVVDTIDSSKNTNTEHSPIGKTDWVEVISKVTASVLLLGLTSLWAYGKLKDGGSIDLNDIKELMKYLGRFEFISDLIS